MPTSIGRNETRRLIDEEHAQVVEVLSRPEYEWTHLAGAIHVPLQSRFRDLEFGARPLTFTLVEGVRCWASKHAMPISRRAIDG